MKGPAVSPMLSFAGSFLRIVLVEPNPRQHLCHESTKVVPDLVWKLHCSPLKGIGVRLFYRDVYQNYQFYAKSSQSCYILIEILIFDGL